MSLEAPASKRQKKSPAWDFLKQYVHDDDLDAVECAVEKLSLHSLQELRSTGYTSEIIKAGKKSPKLFDILAANGELDQRLRDQPIEDRLLSKREFNFNAAGIPEHEVNYDAQFTDNLFTARDDPLPPILIMGSSGSGKTLFATKILSRKLKESTLTDRMFTVYLRADTVRPPRDANIKSSATENEAASRACMEIRRIIESEIDEKISDQRKLDITMMVIIDEVGRNHDKMWMGSKSKLMSLTTKLQSVAKQVQLVLAGTGLDAVSSDLNSDQECVKVRMQPWKSKDVQWWATSCLTLIREDERLELFKLVSSRPILTALTTNARATRFLFETLQRYGLAFDEKSLVDHAVTTTAFMYIKSNGLKDLETKSWRRVARLVLRFLSESKKGESMTFPPELYSEDDEIQRACLSLVETHVEKNKLIVGHDYAISVSPALTIVLTLLMGCTSALSSSWSGFERIAALSELQRCFVASKTDIKPHLIQSELAFPPTNFRKYLKVPNMMQATVVVNGVRAPYADVIGHRRLIQCKHTSKDSAKTLILNEELAKLGVLKDEHYEGDCYLQNRFLTNRLMEQWSNSADGVVTDRNVGVVIPTLGVDKARAFIPNGLTRSMYPMGQLDTTDEPDEIGFELYEMRNGKFYLGDACKHIDWDRSTFSQDITIVFATNGDRFNLKLQSNQGTPYDVSRQHLTNEGEIRREEDKEYSMNNAILNYLDDQRLPVIQYRCDSRLHFCKYSLY